MGGCFTYPAFMLRSEKAILGAGFMLYFCVFGVWGILPIHLAELAPADARALVAGLSYQLGNLASAAASTIETQLADRYPLERDASGAVIKEDYAKVMAILTGSVFIFTEAHSVFCSTMSLIERPSASYSSTWFIYFFITGEDKSRWNFSWPTKTQANVKMKTEPVKIAITLA